jgi:DNA modification methylase
VSLPEINKIHQGDVLEVLRTWPDNFVQTVVTSPPYWGLRDYGVEGQIGLEKTPEEYVAKMIDIFREVRRVLRIDGTLWLNLGDSFARNPGRGIKFKATKATYLQNQQADEGNRGPEIPMGLKEKDLVGIPWMVAFALRADGWYLRSEIIWAKKNCMPESVTDRPTRSHEQIFLLSKYPKYFYDAEAIKEPSIYFDDDKVNGIRPLYKDAKSYDGKHHDKQRGHSRRHSGFNDRWDAMDKKEQCGAMRNKRSVWSVATYPFAEAHFATFTEKLIEPCILAGCPENGLVLDPFMGAGTTGLVSSRLNRNFIGIELNPKYIEMAEKRIRPEMAQGKFA